MRRTLVFAILALSGSAWAGPPAGTEPKPAAPPTAKTPESTKPDATPAIQLEARGDKLHYQYDLASIFDDALWKVLEKYGYSEITVEVRLRDGKDRIQQTRYHRVRIELLDNGKVRVMTSRRRGRIHPSRKDMLAALRTFSGKPLDAGAFNGASGHLELVVMVNPVQVFAFPDKEHPVADKRVVPKTYYDRLLKLRSEPLVAQ